MLCIIPNIGKKCPRYWKSIGSNPLPELEIFVEVCGEVWYSMFDMEYRLFCGGKNERKNSMAKIIQFESFLGCPASGLLFFLSIHLAIG
jgi:hypothetical protein